LEVKLRLRNSSSPLRVDSPQLLVEAAELIAKEEV
tara:strand:+ start:567 stop:671 length:105 start_codon:yes stop_codon:yes gene_type:complete